LFADSSAREISAASKYRASGRNWAKGLLDAFPNKGGRGIGKNVAPEFVYALETEIVFLMI
jgi:hypothetical protein